VELRLFMAAFLLDRGLVVAWIILLDGVRQQSGTAEIRVEDLGGA